MEDNVYIIGFTSTRSHMWGSETVNKTTGVYKNLPFIQSVVESCEPLRNELCGLTPSDYNVDIEVYEDDDSITTVTITMSTAKYYD